MERRAFRMAELATGNREDALDLVQDAMLGLVKSYASKDEQAWAPLFYRILQSRIRDHYRRSKVRNRFRSWLGFGARSDENDDLPDPIQNAPDTRQPDTIHKVLQGEAVNRLQDALQLLPGRQQQLRKGAERWSQMSPEQKKKTSQRFKRWESLTPDRREKLRQRQQRFKQLPPEQQEQLRKRREWFRQLPPERRDALRNKWKGMSPEERKTFRQKHRRRMEQMTPQQRQRMRENRQPRQAR